MSGPTLTINRTTREVTLVRSPIGLQGVPGPAGTSAILEVTDSVANAAALPVATNHENEFWVAEDTGVIWYSNGTDWIEASISSGGGVGDVLDGGTLTTGLTFPTAGLHLLDTNASHDLILSPGSNLTADRTLTLTTGDENRTLTIGASAAVSGSNTGDQDLSGYVARASYDANTILAATTDNTPVALTVAEQTLVGRITSGAIDDLSASTVRTLLNVADGATAAGATGDAYASSHESDTTAHPATSIVNTPAGSIAATTVQAAINELDTEKAAASHVHAGTDITTGTIGTAILGSGTANSGTYLRGDSSWAAVAGGDATQAFGTIIVAGQSNVVADAAPDTLTLVAGTQITLTTDAGADSVTITGTGAAASHAHGNISNAGAIGSTASLPIITSTDGVLAAGAFGTGATNFTAGNDARLSDARTPTTHASSHQNGGADEIATATAAANAIPKTGVAGTLDIGWLPVGTVAGTVAAGDDSRFTAITAVGSGVNFFPTDTTIIASGTNNTYPVKTLSDAPSGAAEDVDSIVIAAGTTVMYGTYLSPVLLNTQLDGGIWEFHIYAGVDSGTGVTTLTENIYRVRPASGTVTVTGTGTSRTATASTGTPFATVNIDASAAIADCSFVQTPLGLYPITARTSDTVVTITTPSGYSNESAVEFSVHKKLFGVTSGEINTLAGASPAYAGIVLLPELQSVQADIPLEPGDRLASSFLGTSSSNRTLYFSHDGTTRYSHFHTPLTFVVDLASGVSGVLPVANGGTGQTSLAAVNAADLGSGAATDNYVLTADGAGGAAWEAASGGYTDEQAQDAVGGMVASSPTVALTYVDATPSLTASLAYPLYTPAISGGDLVINANSSVESYHSVSLNADVNAAGITITGLPSSNVVRVNIRFTQATPGGTLYDVPVTAWSAFGTSRTWDTDWYCYQDATPSIASFESIDGGVNWRAYANSLADATILRQADVDDTPVNGVTTAPVSSNWAYDHAALATAHGITTAAATVLDDATVVDMVNTLGGATATGTGGLVRATGPTIAGATLSGALDGDGYEISRNITRVVTSVTGTLTIGDHSGCLLVTSGNVTVPTTAGFHAVIRAGGAHTVSFNSTTSAAMADGDIMTVFVQSATVIHAVLTAVAGKVTFS